MVAKKAFKNLLKMHIYPIVDCSLALGIMQVRSDRNQPSVRHTSMPDLITIASLCKIGEGSRFNAVVEAVLSWECTNQ
jgi:Na+/H+-dicarboxylate symporter